MRLLAAGDLHGRLEAVQTIARAVRQHGPDAVILCGDITDFGPAQFARDAVQAAGARVLAVPGNCDTEEVVQALCGMPGASIHGARAKVGDWTFLGWGGSGERSNARSIREQTPNAPALLRGLAGNARAGRLVLVLHQPVFGVLDEYRPGQHGGSHDMARLAAELGPAVVLSAHIHECPGILERDGTLFVNPGPAMNGKFAVLDMEPRPRAALFG